MNTFNRCYRICTRTTNTRGHPFTRASARTGGGTRTASAGSRPPALMSSTRSSGPRCADRSRTRARPLQDRPPPAAICIAQTGAQRRETIERDLAPSGKRRPTDRALRAKTRLREVNSRPWGVSMERRIKEINRSRSGGQRTFHCGYTLAVQEGRRVAPNGTAPGLRKQWKHYAFERRYPVPHGIRSVARLGQGLLRIAGSLSSTRHRRPAPGPALASRVHVPLPPLGRRRANPRMRTRTSGGPRRRPSAKRMTASLHPLASSPLIPPAMLRTAQAVARGLLLPLDGDRLPG